jgi:hypothetical protein
MTMALDIDLDEYTGEDVKEIAKGHVLPPPGKYHVRLDGVSTHEAKSGNTGPELVFAILTEPHAGYEIKETLWDRSSDGSADKTKKCKDRQVLFGARIGLLVRGANDKLAYAEGKQDFTDCRGAECVIEIEHEPWENKEKNKKGVSCRMKSHGIWRLDDPAVKDVKKAKPALATATETKAATKPVGKSKKFDASEL